MANSDQNTPRHPIPLNAPEAAQAKSVGRRRLLVNGAPVVLTLASKSVLATNGGGCLSPSATLSGNLSHTQAQTGTCTGTSGTSWCSQTTWPVAKDTSFHSVFAVGNRSSTRCYKSDNITSKTFTEVLQPSATGEARIAAQFVAAYLNIKAGNVPSKVLTAEGLQAMWREWAISSQYTPYAGANPAWDGSAISNYLTTSKIGPM